MLLKNVSDYVTGAANTRVEGITIANSAHHSLMLVMSYKPEEPTDIRWVKIFTWRANGDGINPFGNGLVEDCFIRTQDDSTYVNGRGIRRVGRNLLKHNILCSHG